MKLLAFLLLITLSGCGESEEEKLAKEMQENFNKVVENATQKEDSEEKEETDLSFEFSKKLEELKNENNKNKCDTGNSSDS